MSEKFVLNRENLLVLNRSRVVGGKTSRTELVREDLTGARQELEKRIETVIDDIEERRLAENLVARTHGAIRRVAQATLLGALAPRENLSTLVVEFDDIRREAQAFNASARTCRVDVHLIAIEISIALGPEAVREIADEARSRLGDIVASLRAGDAHKVEGAIRVSKNLAQLAVGPVADAISFALDEARERFRELKDRTKAKSGVAETGESVGRSLDLAMLESAIAMLEYRPASSASANLSLVG